MQHPRVLYTPNWYYATTIAERVATLPTCDWHTGLCDVQRAQRRADHWQAEAPFADPDLFAQRLAMDGLDTERFEYLLGEEITALQGRLEGMPAWVATLGQALAPDQEGAATPLPPLPALQQSAGAGFLEVIKPLINHGRARLQAGIDALGKRYPRPPFARESIEAILYENLPSKLIAMLGRTMVLELNVARLQGVLEGETPADRLQHFLHRLCQPDMLLGLLAEYPVLARQLVTAIAQWVDFSLEFLGHLCVDWPALRHTFGLEPAREVLVAAQSGAGDPHRNGRSVVIAQFSSGRKLVYKPRSLAVEGHFQALLQWLNQRSPHCPFRTLTLLTRPRHGWVEYVQADACHTPEQLAHFYQCQGGYLALLYALEAVDFHYENVIAAGEHPVLVDLESLFHPSLARPPAQQMTHLAIEHSILRVGLLPRRWGAVDNTVGIDMSGLGTPSGQLTPHAVPRLDRAGTDEMRYVRQRVALSQGQHRPTLDGQEVSLRDYREDLTAGFQTIYRVLLKHRDELLSSTGPLAQFAMDEVRVIARPTAFYAQLLSESFHPDVLRDALDRDHHFDYLWLGSKQSPALMPLIRHERHDLHQGDIPLFTTHPQSHQMWSSNGTPIAQALYESGLQRVHQRLYMLSERDLERQVWIINTALDAEAMGQEQRQSARAYLPPHALPATSAQLLEAAGAIGDYLEMLAIRQDKAATWLGLTSIPGHQWALEPLGVDLYSGCPGVVLFLAYLGAITGEARYTALAQAALISLRHHLTAAAASVRNIGVFEGWGGLMYVFTHLGVLWAQPVLLAEAEAMVAHVEAGIEHDTRLDVIGGAAGAILTLRSLYQCRPSARTLAVLMQCGHHLLAHTRAVGGGLACPAPADVSPPLTGMSHGAAGMAWALCELAGLSGERRFRQAAVDAMAYERCLFDARARNWPDLRVDTATDTVPRTSDATFMAAWCHGAPGVGLARLQILRHLDTTEVRTEIDHALHTTLAEGFGHNHSLCHGDLGNVELVLQAGVLLDEPGWLAAAQHLAGKIVASIAAHGWRCGVPQGVETPGLMTGLAGIGYGLLRLARPQGVPSVLTLETPRQCRGT